jgi:hypothetical protein
MDDVLDARGERLMVNMHVRIAHGKPKHGKVVRLSQESVDVQTERGLRTVRPTDLVGVNPGHGRNRAAHAVRLKALLQGATQTPRGKKL